jgi:mannosyl-oligosaccharide alpha-1,2-mannosidase
MEFTRLAQLTGNNTYYDAITRIMDALNEWQDHTGVPGLWPADIDTSGCNTTATPYRSLSREHEPTYVYSEDDDRSYRVSAGAPVTPDDHPSGSDAKTAAQPSESPEMIPLEKPPPLVLKVKEASKNLNKRQIGPIPTDRPEVPDLGIPDHNLGSSDHIAEFRVPAPKARINHKLPECVSKGLDYTMGGWGKYTLGSTADSAYEYLSKMYILLNGQVDRYKTMYEKAIDAANDRLISAS